MSADLPSLTNAEWLRAAPTQTVLACLTARGFGARVVGGAVRNALLRLSVTEVDIATTALPAETMAAAASAGLKTAETGLAHGTVTVIADGQPFEVTTLRRDVDTDGRHATVAFTHDWAADASRRDFTINALYCDAGGTIFDPLGGTADLCARRVRFIGDAHQRIQEDYLRILRFFRFTARYSSSLPDEAGMAACVAMRDGLPGLSAERVRSELYKLVTAPRAAPVIEAMAEHGLLTAILPFAPRTPTFRRLCAIAAEIDDQNFAATIRLAALNIAVTEDARRLALRLRLSGQDRDLISAIATAVPITPDISPAAQRRMLYANGPLVFRGRVLIDWANSGASADDEHWRNLLQLPMRWSAPAVPYAGIDLLRLGLTPGPVIGHILNAFEAWWIASDFPSDIEITRTALRRFADEARGPD